MYHSSFGDLSLFSGKTIIQVYETKSIGDVPSIDITFSNGIKDSVVLEKYYPTQESRLEKEPFCNFFGHLKNEDTACVSLTGCPGQDDLHFTINSENNDQSNMYILKKYGELEIVERTFMVRPTFHIHFSINLIYVQYSLD